jgi:PAS domain S-box-containing protein
MHSLLELEGFQFALEASPVAMLLITVEGLLVHGNRRAHVLFGHERLAGLSVEDLIPRESRDVHRQHRQGYAAKTERREMGAGRDLCALRADGSKISVEVSLNPIERDGRSYVLCSVVDITQRVSLARDRETLLERGLQQDRLHSLGLLASGIAHDFNNLLIAILGNVEFARESVEPDSAMGECLEDVQSAARRAADLASQLMVYSGKGERSLRELSLSQVMESLVTVIRKTVPDPVTLHMDFPAEMPLINADQNQVRQVLLNLLANALQSIGDEPGQVWISTGVQELAQEEWSEQGLKLPAGHYATVQVRDSGCGMSEQTIARMFEPFFTTKTGGHGLGLAATLGILRGHSGGLRVESELGQGTTVSLMFPVA